LLEVLLALALLSMSAMIVVAALPGRDFRADKEAGRLARRMTGLMRIAALDGSLYGLQAQADRWQLKAWRQGGWQALDLPAGGGAQTLPEGWRLTLRVAGEVTGNAPQVLILPGGEITPFRLRYMQGDRAVVEIGPNEDGWPVATELRDAAR
jgi:general secretion pathway protein H